MPSCFAVLDHDHIMIMMDSTTNHAMCFGHTVVVTETGSEVLSNRSLDLLVK